MSRQDVPPEMEFDGEEGLFDVDITEQGPRSRPRRPESAWEKQAATWHGTTHFFECCGTTFGAMNADTLAAMRRLHEASQYHRNQKPTGAVLALGQDV